MTSEAIIVNKVFKYFYKKKCWQSLPVIANVSEEAVHHAVNNLYVMSYIEQTKYLDGRTEYRITKLGKKIYEDLFKLSFIDAALGAFCHYVLRF